MGHAAQFSILGTINTVVGLLSVSLFPQLAGKLNRRNLFFACIAVILLRYWSLFSRWNITSSCFTC